MMCKFDECDRPTVGGGWCRGHYMQARRGVALRPLRINAGGSTSRRTAAVVDLLEDLDHIVGTDDPERIALRVGYPDLATLRKRLRTIADIYPAMRARAVDLLDHSGLAASRYAGAADGRRFANV